MSKQNEHPGNPYTWSGPVGSWYIPLFWLVVLLVVILAGHLR